MSGDLLQTKLYAPRIRPFLVPRPHLIQKLSQGLHHKLTLISAPAGFGKTTLIAEWIHNSQFVTHNLQFGWLSLDKSDNHLHRFLTYLIAALQKAAPDLGRETLASLSTAQHLPTDALLTPLINELATVVNIALVLDDLHVVESQPVYEALVFLLEHLPPNIHLLILTRADPPLNLSRLRSRGEMVEIRAADLRFTVEETAVFLNNIMGLILSAGDVAALEARTEGWITGLQMAALSMQGRGDVSAFIAAFTGSHRYILDYLTEEVLEQQPEGIQQFLLETAVLNRLCADLCDAVLGIETIANLQSPISSQQILEQLETANLFIIPLDDERRWYRYHHLFADLLQNRLQRANPDRTPILHQRAANWYANHGDPHEAVHHALSAKDYRLTGRIIQDNWRRLFHQGWISTTLNWLDSLPPELLRRLPPLSIAMCWSLSLRGDYGRIPSHLIQAEKAFEELVSAGALPESHPEYVLLSGQFCLLHSVLARVDGDVPAAIRHAEEAVSGITAVESQLGAAFVQLGYGAAMVQLAYGHLANGGWEQAAQYFDQSRRYARQSENFIAMCACAFELARLYLQAGRLPEAEAVCQETLALAEQPRYADWPAFFIVHIGLAETLRALGRLDEAMPHLERGLDLGRRSGHVLYLAHGYLAAERLYRAQEKLHDAQSARQKAERLLHQVGLVIDELPLEDTAVSPQPLIEPLTEREQDVLRLIAAGLSNRKIGDELCLSLNTIKSHTKTLYGKLDVHTRTQAVNKARELGLITS